MSRARDDAEFTFESSYSADFYLWDGDSDDSGWLEVGSYTVAEIVPDGWYLTSLTSDDLETTFADETATVDLDAG